jgi:hypothetical protein
MGIGFACQCIMVNPKNGVCPTLTESISLSVFYYIGLCIHCPEVMGRPFPFDILYSIYSDRSVYGLELVSLHKLRRLCSIYNKYYEI